MAKIYPDCTQEECRFFNRTPKRVLFEMLRDAASLLVSLQVDGYAADEHPLLWMWQAQHVGESIPEELIPEELVADAVV